MASRKVNAITELGKHLHSLDLALQLTELYIDEDNKEKAQTYIKNAQTILEVTRMVFEKIEKKTN